MTGCEERGARPSRELVGLGDESIERLRKVKKALTIYVCVHDDAARC
jgi:hypothetical protein